MPNVDNLRVWYEYDILGWPPILLAQKYNIGVSRICNYARKNRDRLENGYIPTKWLCEPRWDKDKNSIELNSTYPR